MPKILIAECRQEVSTFNPNPSGYADFGIRYGQELVKYHRGVRNEITGALKIFAEHPDIEVVPTYSALLITSGGTLAAAAWRRIADEFLGAVRAAGPVDGIYFCLHGAMASAEELDPEGYLLTETRKIVGENLPLVASFDLHGILTDRMVEAADAIVVYHTYPHIDFFETGERAARLLLRVMAGEVQPVTAKVAIPALVRGSELVTASGLFGQNMQQAEKIEASPKGLSAGMFIGNPFTDVPALQSYSFVVADNDPALAEREAIRMAETFWTNHEKMQVPLVSLEEMAKIALATEQGTLGLVDAADATSSGASGDSNAIMRQFLASGYKKRVLLPMVDAPAVQAAIKAGVGAKIPVSLGGTLDPGRFRPLPVHATVRMLGDGRIFSESFGDYWPAGLTAVLEVDNFTVVVSTRAVSLYDRSFFYAHGQDPKRFDAVVIKSPHCQYRFFEAWCVRMVNVDAPGSTSANLKSLGHTRCPRPIFPLDPVVPYTPKAKLFRRARAVQKLIS